MITTNQTAEVAIRDLMPAGYLKIIKKRTGASEQTINRAVLAENQRSKVWPAIIELAEETKKEQERLRQLKTA